MILDADVFPQDRSPENDVIPHDHNSAVGDPSMTDPNSADVSTIQTEKVKPEILDPTHDFSEDFWTAVQNRLVSLRSCEVTTESSNMSNSTKAGNYEEEEEEDHGGKKKGMR